MHISHATRSVLAPLTLSSLFFSSALRELPAQNISTDDLNSASAVVEVQGAAKHAQSADILTRAKQTSFEGALQGLRQEVELRLRALQEQTQGQVLNVPLVNLTTNFGKSLGQLQASLEQEGDVTESQIEALKVLSNQSADIAKSINQVAKLHRFLVACKKDISESRLSWEQHGEVDPAVAKELERYQGVVEGLDFALRTSSDTSTWVSTLEKWLSAPLSYKEHREFLAQEENGSWRGNPIIILGGVVGALFTAVTLMEYSSEIKSAGAHALKQVGGVVKSPIHAVSNALKMDRAAEELQQQVDLLYQELKKLPEVLRQELSSVGLGAHSADFEVSPALATVKQNLLLIEQLGKLAASDYKALQLSLRRNCFEFKDPVKAKQQALSREIQILGNLEPGVYSKLQLPERMTIKDILGSIETAKNSVILTLRLINSEGPVQSADA